MRALNSKQEQETLSLAFTEASEFYGYIQNNNFSQFASKQPTIN